VPHSGFLLRYGTAHPCLPSFWACRIPASSAGERPLNTVHFTDSTSCILHAYACMWELLLKVCTRLYTRKQVPQTAQQTTELAGNLPYLPTNILLLPFAKSKPWPDCIIFDGLFTSSPLSTYDLVVKALMTQSRHWINEC
jgi:hypothetical protein